MALIVEIWVAACDLVSCDLINKNFSAAIKSVDISRILCWIVYGSTVFWDLLCIILHCP